MKRWMILALTLAFALGGCAGEKKDAEPAAQAGKDQPAAQAETPQQQTPPAAAPAPETTPTTPAPETKPATTPAKPAEPKAEPAKNEPVTKLVTLVPGYEFQVVLDQAVSTETHQAGQAFGAKLVKPAVLKTAGAVIPAGSAVRGEVTLSHRAGRVGGKAELTLEFRELKTPDGQTYPLFAQPLALQGESTASGDVQKVVGTTVGGAIVGGILGGKDGAVKGGAAGAAGGAAWAVATRGNDIAIDPGQVIQVTLQRELRVPVTVPAGNAIP